MTIGFDFDGTLTDESFSRFVSNISVSLNNAEILLITTRSDVDDEIVKKVKELGLKEVKAFAIGDGGYQSKAAFVADEEIALDIFFDNDPYEIEPFIKMGVLAVWIPPMNEESLMAEIYEGFIKDKYTEFFGAIGCND